MLPDIGLAELFIVLLVALLVLGPKELPTAARHLARFIRAVGRVSRNIHRQILGDDF